MCTAYTLGLSRFTLALVFQQVNVHNQAYTLGLSRFTLALVFQQADMHNQACVYMTCMWLTLSHMSHSSCKFCRGVICWI